MHLRWVFGWCAPTVRARVHVPVHECMHVSCVGMGALASARVRARVRACLCTCVCVCVCACAVHVSHCGLDGQALAPAAVQPSSWGRTPCAHVATPAPNHAYCLCFEHLLGLRTRFPGMRPWPTPLPPQRTTPRASSPFPPNLLTRPTPAPLAPHLCRPPPTFTAALCRPLLVALRRPGTVCRAGHAGGVKGGPAPKIMACLCRMRIHTLKSAGHVLLRPMLTCASFSCPSCSCLRLCGSRLLCNIYDMGSEPNFCCEYVWPAGGFKL